MKVKVESFRGSLRLRWTTPQGRKSLALGIPDTPSHRVYAQQRATQIELDLLSGNYDAMLLKYKPRALGTQASQISCPELFKQFTAHRFKEKGLAPGSIRRYQPIQSCLEQRLNVPAHRVNDEIAGNYAAQLLERVASRTAKERLWMLAACWDWAKGRYHIADENPWTAQVQRIKPNPQQRVKPFTTAEVVAILGAFRSSPHYSHYADFVYFLFGVGCRFGEAAGLRWRHVADDFQTLWIGESVNHAG